ncbi:MAG: glycosyltransferase [Chitinophagaceae bacterium]
MMNSMDQSTNQPVAMPACEYPGVTLLITHYNRSRSLERLLAAFASLGCVFGETVVSDDGSKPEHLAYVQELQNTHSFKLVTTPVNKGLGHNINKGQDAVTKPYTLYVQEDFMPTPLFPAHFAAALAILNERPDLDMARFYAYFKYPYLRPCRDDFSEMRFRLWYPGYKKFYAYSDHPHLRRSNFFDRFGRYAEGVKGDVTEYRMMLSFLKKKGKGIFSEHYRELFLQKNSSDEPSTMKRTSLRESKNPVISLIRHLYRHVKLNKDYLS